MGARCKVKAALTLCKLNGVVIVQNLAHVRLCVKPKHSMTAVRTENRFLEVSLGEGHTRWPRHKRFLLLLDAHGRVSLQKVSTLLKLCRRVFPQLDRESLQRRRGKTGEKMEDRRRDPARLLSSHSKFKEEKRASGDNR